MAVIATACLLGGCGAPEGRGGEVEQLAAEARVAADTSARVRWPLASPAEVAPGRDGAGGTPVAIARASDPAAGVAPEAAPSAPPEDGAPPSPNAAGFKPPLLKQRPSLARLARRDSVDLDVLVDPRGLVARVLHAGGSGDSVLVRAATECARGMTFYPGLQGGRPVPAWTRQRFRFGVRGGVE